MSDAVRSIIEEYSTSIVDGASSEGDFYLVTHKQIYLDEICRRIKPLGYMLSDTNFDQKGMYCTSRFQPHDEWFEHPYFFKF
jgi:hypothetical protein